MAEGFGLGEPVLDEGGRPVDIRYLEVNDAYYRQTGIPRGIEGRPLREILPQLEQAWIDRLAAVALTGQAARFVDYNADTGRHYEVYAFSPGPGRFANVFRDVTEQRRMEQALQESESSLRELIATLPGMVWTTTGSGAVDFVSQQWLDYTGTTLESQLDAGFLEAVHPEERERVAAAWERAVAGGVPYQAEYRLRSQDGGYRRFNARSKPVWRRDGQVSRWLGVAIDIDARKRAEDSLRQERSRLQAIIDNSPLLILVKDMEGRVVLANKAIFEYIKVPPREKFIGRSLYVTARFPVHDIETQELIGICAISTDISEQKAVEAQVQRLNVELEHRVLAPLSQETGAEVRCGPMPRLSVNRSQIAQVFQNLIENGVKYNQSKPPRVSIRCDLEEGEWVFAVADNGISIDPGHHERIFEIFRRLHAYHHVPGNGIGLALCRRIVERHGGRIWVESRPGEGSTFYFTLPVRAGGD